MQPSTSAGRQVRHHPVLPPSNPAFLPIIESLPRVIAEQGPAHAAKLLRAQADMWCQRMSRAAAGDEAALARMAELKVDAFDMDALVQWCLSRAAELEATVQ